MGMQKRNLRPFICMLFVCIFFLPGCSPTAKEGSTVDTSTAFSNIADEATDSPAPTMGKVDYSDEFHLAYQSLPLPGQIKCATAQCLVGERIMIGGLSDSGVVLAWTDFDRHGGILELPKNVDYIYALCASEAGFFLLGGSFPPVFGDARGNMATNAQADGHLTLAAYDTDGQLQATNELEKLYPEQSERFCQMVHVEDNLILLSQSYLVKISQNGIELGRIVVENSGQMQFVGMAIIEDSMYVLTAGITDNTNASILCIDYETFEQKQEFIIQSYAVYGIGLNSRGQLLLNISGGGEHALSVFNLDTCSFDLQFDWGELAAQIPASYIQEFDGGYLFFSRNEGEIELLLWESGEKPEAVCLSMAVTGGTYNGIDEIVRAFNLSQQRYQISITTYADMIENGDQTLDSLRTQILAGDSPDLFCLSPNDYDGEAGLSEIEPETICIDLMPYLENDSVCTKENFVPTLINAVTIDGSVYYLPLGFSITTFLAPGSLISQPGVTLQELEAARQTAGSDWLPFESWMDAQNLFLLSIPFYVERYIDKTSESCNFTSQEFLDYLNWCKTWAGDGSTPAAMEQAILKLGRITNCEYVASLSDMATRWYGEPNYTYAGVPVESGFGNTFSIELEIGISKSCTHPDAAWEFVRFCNSCEENMTQFLPSSISALHSQLDYYLSGDATDWMGNPVQSKPEDVDKFYCLLEETNTVAGTEPTLVKIVSEEVTAYFANVRSASEVAENIQNRVSLYLAENHTIG